MRSVLHGDTISITASWGYLEKTSEDGKEFNQITISPPASTRGVIATVSQNPDLIEIEQVGTVANKVVSVARPSDSKGDVVRIYPKQAPVKGGQYRILVKTGADGKPGFLFKKGGTAMSFQNPIAVVIVDTTSGLPAPNQNFDTKNLKFNTSGAIALLSGSTKTPLLSGKTSLNYGRIIDDKLFVTTDATADINVAGRQVKNYFNSLTADTRITDVLPDTNDGRFFLGHGEPEIGLVNKFESDRDFRTINETFGLGVWTPIDNAGTRALADALFINNNGRWVSISPMVAVTYDYVVKVSSGSGSFARAVDTGNNRITGKLDWPLWVARGIDLRDTPLKSIYSVDILVDLSAIYDIDKSNTFFEEDISLEIKPDDPSDPKAKDKPAFTLTYANGKATPTFTNVNAILAGVRMPW